MSVTAPIYDQTLVFGDHWSQSLLKTQNKDFEKILEMVFAPQPQQPELQTFASQVLLKIRVIDWGIKKSSYERVINVYSFIVASANKVHTCR